MLLLWLSIICMIPFDMSRLDSNVRDETGDIVREPIMMRLLNIAKVRQIYLIHLTLCRDVIV